MRNAFAIVLAGSLLAATGCKKDKKDREDEGGEETNSDDPATPSDFNPTRHTVLIIDDGFDFTHPVFKDKIAGKYTITCDEEKKHLVDVTKSFDEQKAAMIADYGKQDGACVISDGLQFQLGADYAEVQDDRDLWNGQILAKKLTLTPTRIEQIREVISGSKSDSSYHGTNTAGLIAYQNPEVRLVLIQLELKDASDSTVDDAKDCPTQKELDDWVKLHEDAEVKAAYMAAPLGQLTERIIEIEQKHAVTLVNLSLGSYPRSVLEERLKADGCGTLNYLAYFTARGNLVKERELARLQAGKYKEANPLTVQAAGNDGAQVDSYADTSDCSAPELNQVIMGAANADGAHATFSNKGQCVDFYMLGASVVVAAPDDFLDVADGTSFSTPLAVRYLTKTTAPNTRPAAMIQHLKNAAKADKTLNGETFPHELAFENEDDKIDVYALTRKNRPATLVAPLAFRELMP